ncbi:uncharacterized protein LOC100277793 [Zea mays]|uniref:uncharacterized protein LOC100277793 n=1 Tax=Zea mays TaxID=4577 RepID=UPI0002218644|nr:uncharacterized protein LOC100277793 [Zea mays]
MAPPAFLSPPWQALLQAHSHGRRRASCAHVHLFCSSGAVASQFLPAGARPRLLPLLVRAQPGSASISTSPPWRCRRTSSPRPAMVSPWARAAVPSARIPLGRAPCSVGPIKFFPAAKLPRVHAQPRPLPRAALYLSAWSPAVSMAPSSDFCLVARCFPVPWSRLTASCQGSSCTRALVPLLAVGPTVGSSPASVVLGSKYFISVLQLQRPPLHRARQPRVVDLRSSCPAIGSASVDLLFAMASSSFNTTLHRCRCSIASLRCQSLRDASEL